MLFPYTTIEKYLPNLIEPGSIFLEIGSERGAGSTVFLSDLAKKYNVTLHTVDLDNTSDIVPHSNLITHTACGSDWCKTILPTLNKSVSLVYLDNFDIITDNLMAQGNYESSEWNRNVYNDLKGEDWPQDFTPWHKMPLNLKNEIWTMFGRQGKDFEAFKHLNFLTKHYQENFGIELNNNNCQIEHLNQLLAIEPYLSKHCTILFDDTFTVEECWSGKCGPCVIYLQCKGFKIQNIFSNGIVLTR
jgi:hypothetical protein